jgi:hypothetical protein
LSELVRNTRTTDTDSHGEDDREQPAEIAPLPEGFAVLCRIAMSSTEAREWLNQNCSEDELGNTEGWTALHTVLRATFDPADPVSVAGFLATCPPSVERQLAGLDARHMSGNPLSKAGATLIGIRREILTRQREIVKTRLLQAGLPPKEILEIQKELLDLQKRLNELPHPAFVETCA